jgi:hypothetical protein
VTPQAWFEVGHLGSFHTSMALDIAEKSQGVVKCQAGQQPQEREPAALVYRPHKAERPHQMWCYTE